MIRHCINNKNTGFRKKILTKLRRWVIFLGISLIVLLSGNIYLSMKIITFNHTKRLLQTVQLMKDTIENLKNVNNQASLTITKANQIIQKGKEELFRDILAGIIVEHFAGLKFKVDFFECIEIVRCSQIYAKHPFSYIDLLTLAWVENDFNSDIDGKFGERGVWQILKWENYCKQLNINDPRKIENNCKMAMLELQNKYERKKNYKDAIVSYNGWVIKDGEVSRTYYKNFISKRRVMERWCRESDKRINFILK